MPTSLDRASWIWVPLAVPSPHQYVCFRRSFELAAPSKEAGLFISVDSDFVAWVNGVEAGRGQFSDYPPRKTYTRLEAGPLLRPGRNTLAILAYHRGEDFSDHRAGRPGLLAALRAGEVEVASDASWKAWPHPAFRAGPVPKVTIQMGFTAEYDARRDERFEAADFDDSAWPAAEALAGATDGFWRELLPRPVPPLEIKPPVRVRVVAQGDYTRLPVADDAPTAARMRASSLRVRPPAEVFANPELADPYPHGYTSRFPVPGDWLDGDGAGCGLELRPPEPGTEGRFFLVDLGQEEVGLLTLRLDAGANDAATLDLGHGEHLDDGRVRMHVGGRNFADRYRAKPGLNEFTLPFRRLGARYLEVHVSGHRAPVRLGYVGLRPTELPLPPEAGRGAFEAGDRMAEAIHRVAARTLHLCMHEHYEDCPWREQALYGFDSRNQALYGYYAFGNYDFARVSFDLLGRGLRDDGLLELCAPAKVRITIPIFSFAWIVEVAEHWLYSGDPTLFEAFGEQIAAMLRRALSRCDDRTGLYRLPEGPEMWHFYEWSDGLAGKIGEHQPDGRLDAPYNLFLMEALRAYVSMLRWAGREDDVVEFRKARLKLAGAVHAAFWDARRGAYATYLHPGSLTHHCELVQNLALDQGVCGEDSAAFASAINGAGELVPMTLSSQLYKVLALMGRGQEHHRRAVAGPLLRQWEAMLRAGATSFWETMEGGNDFAYAGSLCHGWSALPVYYYGAWVLGVRPRAPGFRRFVVSPYPDRFGHARGRVPTPSGPIEVAWTRERERIHLEMTGPEALTPEARALPGVRLARASYNGQRLRVRPWRA